VKPVLHSSKNQPYKGTTKEKIYSPISLMKIDAKIFNSILAKYIQQHIKSISFQGCEDGSQYKSINVIQP
jgi:hypothetical protein